MDAAKMIDGMTKTRISQYANRQTKTKVSQRNLKGRRGSNWLVCVWELSESCFDPACASSDASCWLSQLSNSETSVLVSHGMSCVPFSGLHSAKTAGDSISKYPPCRSGSIIAQNSVEASGGMMRQYDSVTATVGVDWFVVP